MKGIVFLVSGVKQTVALAAVVEFETRLGGVDVGAKAPDAVERVEGDFRKRGEGSFEASGYGAHGVEDNRGRKAPRQQMAPS